MWLEIKLTVVDAGLTAMMNASAKDGSWLVEPLWAAVIVWVPTERVFVGGRLAFPDFTWTGFPIGTPLS